MDKDKLLITGSEGTIGRILVPSLIKSFDVVQLDKRATRKTNTVFATDISELEDLKRVFKTICPLKYVIHLAGNPDPNADWDNILKNNIIGTRNLYECAREFQVKKIILASSTHLFGNYEGYPERSPLGRPIKIFDPPRPGSYYGISKGFGELLARQFYDLYGIETICLRIGSVWPNDKPLPPWKNIWLSHRDLTQVFIKALESTIPFGIYFATSDNDQVPFDLEPTKKDLGY